MNTKAVKTLGAFVRVQGGIYVAGFAVVEDDVLVREDRFPAPPDEDLPRQLAELHAHASDMIGHHQVEAVALKESEIQGGTRNASIARRAEGAVLAAAGETRELLVTTWLGASMWRPAGFARRPTNAEVIAALADQLQPPPASEETRQASAAARVAILSRI